MSFFDEDDEPARTTQRTSVRPKPRPRRGSPAGGGSRDGQQLLIRRVVFALVAALILFFVIFLVDACNDRRHDNALKDYNRQISGIATESRNTGSGFFRIMDQGGAQSPQDLYGQIVSFNETAENSLKQAQAITPPDDMKQAHQALLIALELRRDALTRIAQDIRPALGDEGEAADKAINSIAAQMRAFDASDVLYDARVVPFIKEALKDVGGQTIETSQFLREISWVGAPYVASKLDQQLSSSGDGTDRGGGEPTGPGLHGSGLDATSYGNVTLQSGASNRLPYTTGTPFTVSFTNQGDNDEFNVKVTLRIARESGSPITLSKTVPTVAKGQKATVTLPLNREPPLDTVVTISVSVASVPGEQKTDNNKATYPSLFVQG